MHFANIRNRAKRVVLSFQKEEIIKNKPSQLLALIILSIVPKCRGPSQFSLAPLNLNCLCFIYFSMGKILKLRMSPLVLLIFPALVIILIYPSDWATHSSSLPLNSPSFRYFLQTSNGLYILQVRECM